MSFRVRVTALILVIAVTAIAATAWLTLRQANRQVTDSLTASERDAATITSTLIRYAQEHADWGGVDQSVRELSEQTGTRIRLLTDAGAVVADSDLLAGRPARPTASAPTVLDPRPVLAVGDGVPADEATATLAGTVTSSILQYRVGVLLATCLRQAGGQVVARPGPAGVPVLTAADPDLPSSKQCVERSVPTYAETAADGEAVKSCLNPKTRGATSTEDAVTGCLRTAFTRRIADIGPPPLRLHLGALDEKPAGLQGGPVAVAAIAVAVAAILGALLLSRRVLRPIAALTAASAQLGAGDLSHRVSATGNDELATLARSFNRMADSLQRSEERQRHLVADVAHELRTPLANLRGYLEALRDGVVPPDPEVFASLHEEALLQQRIVDDLQDLALAEAGRLAYHRTPVDLIELAETCRTAHRAAADTARVRLLVRGSGPVHVAADADRLRQVLGNLITNALRVTGPGGTVALTIGRENTTATITVSDTGTGIAADDLAHLFDRFWRADTARGRSTGGSGLGLAIARQIVTDHGGDIAAASQLGGGTTFTITLPAGDDRVGGPRG